MNTPKILLKYYLMSITVFFIGRIFLTFIYFDKLDDFSFFEFVKIFIYGLRMDTIVASAFLLIPLLLLTFSHIRYKSFFENALKYYILAFMVVFLFMEVATFSFIDQYNVRPNYMFVEYLGFPKQIFAMIVEDYLFELVLAVVLIVVFVTLYLKKLDHSIAEPVFSSSVIQRTVVFVSVFLVLLLGARSSLDRRPANISDALWSYNRTANEITKNSLHSVMTDVVRNIRHQDDKNHAKQYGKIKIDEAFKNVKNLLALSNAEAHTLKRKIQSHFDNKNSKNIVIILVESFGAKFVEAVGGEKGLTPNLNALSKEGLLFTNAYSNGTRSNRALVGISTGFLAIPGEQLLKRNKAQQDFSSIAKLLKPYGYQTSFMYGGESRFDNMGNFFMGNGFHHIVEKRDFDNPMHKGSWGVSDEDLLSKANDEFRTLYAKKQKFASLVFTLSSHSPFDIPQGKVKPCRGKDSDYKTAIKYADFALGEFFKKAKKEEYFKDTVFVVLADHNLRYSGDEIVPVSDFQIPALIISENLKPMKYERIATQPDILATALDLSGLNLTYQIIGNSVFNENKKDFALLQFHKNYAFLKGEEVAIMRPDKEVIEYRYKNKRLSKETIDDKLLKEEAISLVNVVDYMYQNRLYQ